MHLRTITKTTTTATKTATATITTTPATTTTNETTTTTTTTTTATGNDDDNDTNTDTYARATRSIHAMHSRTYAVTCSFILILFFLSTGDLRFVFAMALQRRTLSFTQEDFFTLRTCP